MYSCNKYRPTTEGDSITPRGFLTIVQATLFVERVGTASRQNRIYLRAVA